MHYHQPERTDRAMPVLLHDQSVALADSQVVDCCRPKNGYVPYDSSLDEMHRGSRA